MLASIVGALSLAPLGATGATAAVSDPGTPYTWGSNGFGQLGNGTTSPASPAAVAGLDGVVDLHGGREHIVALTSAGQVFTWGSNVEGQLGLGDSANRSRPTQVTVPCVAGQVTAVETGHNNTLALCGNGSVFAWGLNADGQLGDGSRTLRRSPVRVTGLTGAVAIAAGRDMSYAVKSDGTVWAWGDNMYGELGDGTTVDRVTPVQVKGLTDVMGIAGGRNHGLALRTDGSVWAFGWNVYGQLGDGTTTDRPLAVQVIASGISEVIAGAHHSYALRSGDGQVLSWGRNYRSELGDGSTTTRTRPVSVAGVAGAVSIGSGRDHGLAVLANGSVRAWGYNAGGQLGDGTTTDRTRAVAVPGISGATRAGGGGNEYSVVVVATGTAPDSAPTARISVTCVQLDCTFDGSGSTDKEGPVSGHSWTFGDQSPEQAGDMVTHRFAGPGTYQVRLTVLDSAGASGSTTTDVTVSVASPAAPTFRTARVYDGTSIRPTLTVPSTVTAGDQLVLFVTTNRNATATTPAGWTMGGTIADGADVRSWVFTRSALASTANSSVAVPLDDYSKTNATLLAYSGAGQPAAPVGAFEPASTTAHKAPAAPVAAAGSTVVSFWADKVSAAHGWSLPSGLTSRSVTAGAGAGALTTTSGDASSAQAGTWPGATATAGAASAKAVAWTVVLPPA